MQLTNTPGKLVLPFANAGAKNTIPTASQISITAGAASLTDGFPPLTRTPIAAGGVPPSGLDMNGILFQLSAILRWANAGGGYAYDAAFATDSNVGGYPKGARIMRSDGLGYWFNTVENNTTDPEAAGAAAAGWVPDFTNGVTSVAMASANVTLTPLQYGKPIIVITGTLTANLNLIFPALAGEWIVVNNCTGNFTVTAKTASGTGVVVASGGKIRIVWGDGTNIYSAMNAGDTAAQFDNSTLFATTAFVQRAIGGFGQLVSYGTAGQTIPASQANSHINLFGTCSSITLPLANSVPAGSVLMFDGVSITCTINRQGTNVIFLNGANTSATSLVVNDGENVMFTSDGSTSWFASGIATIKYSAGFIGSTSLNGYQKLPSGLIIQWGSSASIAAGVSGTVTFPIAFPNAILSASATPGVTANTTTPTGAGIQFGSTTNMTIRNLGATLGYAFQWIAIGY